MKNKPQTLLNNKSCFNNLLSSVSLWLSWSDQPKKNKSKGIKKKIKCLLFICGCKKREREKRKKYIKNQVIQSVCKRSRTIYGDLLN